MPSSRFIIVDSDAVAGNALCRSLSSLGYAFPVASLEEVGDRWPSDCSIFVSDEDDQLSQVIEFVRERGIYYPIIPYGSNPSPQRVVETIRHGVISYLDWPCSQERLLSVLTTISETCDALFKRNSERARALSLLKTLTPREADVLENISVGASTKEVAARLGISPKTVEIHRANIFTKLRVRNAIEAVRVAFEVNIPELSFRPELQWGSGIARRREPTLA